MNRLNRWAVSIVIPGFMLAALAVNPVLAQDKAKAGKGQATIKVLAENEKLKAYEIWYKPGDVNLNVPSSSVRVARVLRDGTLLRTHPDGKTEKVEMKSGEVRINMPSGPYTTKNIGKSELALYIVQLK
jgi:hypothetical protein